MKIRTLSVVVLALVVAVAPAAAEIYTVKLANGNEFDTQYRPKEAGWDSDVILLLSDVGNWIAVERADIVEVEVATEREGFGKVIDTHTVALGWAPNDAPTDNPEESLDPMTQLFNFLAAERADQRDYSVQQFVEPSETGQGGLPVSGLTQPESGVQNYFGGGNTAFPVRSGSGQPSQPEVIDQ